MLFISYTGSFVEFFHCVFTCFFTAPPFLRARFKVKVNYVKHSKHSFDYLLQLLLLPKLFNLKTIPTAIIVIFLAEYVALIIYTKFVILAAL